MKVRRLFFLGVLGGEFILIFGSFAGAGGDFDGGGLIGGGFWGGGFGEGGGGEVVDGFKAPEGEVAVFDEAGGSGGALGEGPAVEEVGDGAAGVEGVAFGEGVEGFDNGGELVG